MGAPLRTEPKRLVLDLISMLIYFFNPLKGQETILSFCCPSTPLSVAISGVCLKAAEKRGARVRLGLWFGQDSKQMFRQLLAEAAQSPL